MTVRSYKPSMRDAVAALAAVVWLCAAGFAAAATSDSADPLPSWTAGEAKARIIGFVEATTTEGSEAFIPPAERIAVFDNDGTLWGEKPVYFQAQFVFDRVRAEVEKHPEWRTREPFKSVLDNNPQGLAAAGEHGLLELVMATHADMTVDEFDKIVREWLKSAKDPRFKRLYSELVYQPMLEVLNYLRANGYKTFIVSGGGIEFMRVFAEEVYGIPPEQIIGSSIKTKYEVRDGKPVLARLGEIDFIDDKAGKPVGIQKHIGRRPIIAFGNSDGDFEMLEWTTSGHGLRLGAIVHHDDEAREWAYDKDSAVGRLDRALAAAAKNGWLVVSMKNDWQRIFPDDAK